MKIKPQQGESGKRIRVQTSTRYVFRAIIALSFLSLYARAQESPPVRIEPERPPQPVLTVPGEEGPELADVRQLVHQNPDSALVIINRHLGNTEDPAYEDWLFEYLLASGLSEIDKGAYEQGKQLCLQAVLQSRKTGHFFLNSSRAFSNIGNAYSYQSEYREAAKYYYYAVTIGETDTTVAPFLGSYYNNMATVLLSIGQNDRAIFYLNKAEAAHMQSGSTRNLPSTYNNLGVAYSRKGDPDKAWEYFSKALDISRQFGKEQSEIAALINLGAACIERGEPAKGIPYLKAVLEKEKGVNPYYKETNALCLLGTAYLYLKDYASAEKYLLLTLERARELGIPEFTQEAHGQLADLYSETGDFQKAFRHQEAFMTLKDSLTNKEKTEAINLLEVKYRTTQKDKELVEKQLLIRDQERKLTRKNIWIVGIASGTVALLVLFAAVYQKYRHRQRIQAKQILILKQEREIDRLKAMMQGEEKERTRLARELHDGVGGTLAAVKMNFAAVQKHFPFLQKEESFSEAMEMLDTMSTELREAAHNLMPESVVQNGLPEAVRRYCEQITKAKDLDIEFQVYGSFSQLDPDTVITIYRIIQELLHNIVKHAKATHAIVQLSLHDHLLSIVLEDNGIGFNPDEETTGIGLKNLRSRVQRMNGHMTIETASQKDPNAQHSGTTVYLEFDLTTPKKILT
jgi:signal transduction histidine kinase